MSEAPAPLGRRAPEQRQAAVLEAARSLFLADGVGGTSIAAIAERAGVAKGTVFLYFPTKEHIVQAIEADFNERIVERTSAAAAAAPAGNAIVAWCTELVRAYLDELEVHDMLFYSGAAATREGAADNALIEDLATLLAAQGHAAPAATAAFLVGGITTLTDRAVLEGSIRQPAELLQQAGRLVAAAITSP